MGLFSDTHESLFSEKAVNWCKSLPGDFSPQFRKSVMEIWKMRRAELKTNFIVIEPITKELHKTTS